MRVCGYTSLLDEQSPGLVANPGHPTPMSARLAILLLPKVGGLEERDRESEGEWKVRLLYRRVTPDPTAPRRTLSEAGAGAATVAVHASSDRRDLVQRTNGTVGSRTHLSPLSVRCVCDARSRAGDPLARGGPGFRPRAAGRGPSCAGPRPVRPNAATARWLRACARSAGGAGAFERGLVVSIVPSACRWA